MCGLYELADVAMAYEVIHSVMVSVSLGGEDATPVPRQCLQPSQHRIRCARFLPWIARVSKSQYSRSFSVSYVFGNTQRRVTTVGAPT